MSHPQTVLLVANRTAVSHVEADTVPDNDPALAVR